MIKKILSFLLLIVLCIMISLPVFALSNEIYSNVSQNIDDKTTQESYHEGNYTILIEALREDDADPTSTIVLNAVHLQTGTSYFVSLYPENSYEGILEVEYSGKYELSTGYIVGGSSLSNIEYVQFEITNSSSYLPIIIGDINKIKNLPSEKGCRINGFGEAVEGKENNINENSPEVIQQKNEQQISQSKKSNLHIIIILVSAVVILILTIFTIAKRKQ